MSNVLVTRRLPDAWLTGLAVHDVTMWEAEEAMPRAAFLERLEEADGVLTVLTDRVDEEALDRGRRLKIVSQMAVGVDNIDLRACVDRGVIVGHTPDVLTETTADTAFALLASAVRRLPEGERHVASGAWDEWRPTELLGGDLHRTTLGIVGMGRIGEAIARRAAGFEMRVLYASRSRRPELEARNRFCHRTLEELLEQSDHVVLALPLTAETRHVIDAEALSRMRQGSTLVNIGRGGLVDHDALVEALRRGRPARAALDVTDPEPLPSDHPLVAAENCLVVPHIGSASWRTREAMATLAVRNLLAGLEGRPLPAEV